MKVGQNDKFERIYMAKFEAIASEFGEFVKYERDRAGRDIGLHFTNARSSGGENVSSVLTWFQMKGRQSSTFSKSDFEKAERLSLPLEVHHLQFWYICPEPTYLIFYIESVDKFFILNIKAYVAENFGDAILQSTKKTITVYLNKKSVLDDQAFHLMFRNHSMDTWASRIAEGDKFAKVFFRDANLIKRISTSQDRNVSMRMTLRKYMSKMRSEVHFGEVELNSSSEVELVHQQWYFMMPENLDMIFPYLDIKPLNEEEEDWWEEDEFPDFPPITLPSGQEVQPEGGYEITDYHMAVELNDLGKSWVKTLQIMEKCGFIEVNQDELGWVSVAPWHSRDI